MSERNRKDLLWLLFVTASAILCCAAVSIIYGWQVQSEWLTRLYFFSSPYPLPLAFCLLAIALAQLSLCLGWPKPAIIFATSGFVLSAVSLLAAAFDFSLSLETLLLDTTQVSQFLPKTELICYQLIALSLALQSANVWKDKGKRVTGLFSLLVFAAIILCYTGLSVWLNMTTLGKSFIAILALLNWFYNRKLTTSERANPALLAGVGIFAISATVSFILWFQMEQKESHQAKKVSLEEANLIKHQMEKSLNATLLALQRMANRWVIRGGTPFDEWQYDANNYVSDNAGLRAVEWVDSSFHIRWVEPLAGNEAALNLDLSFEPKREKALIAATESQTYTITKAIELVQGGKGFLAYFPLFNQQNSFEGFILGVFDINALISSHLPSNFHQEYELTLKESDNLIFKNTDNIQTSKQRKFVSTSINIRDVKWTFYIRPTESRFLADSSSLPLITLMNGLIVSLLMGLASYLGISSRAVSIALEQSEDRSQAIVNNAIDSIITINRRGAIISVNNATEIIFGYRQEELVGHNIKMLMPEPFHSEHDGYISTHLKTGKKKIIGIGREVAGKRKDGHVFPIELGVSKFESDGEVFFCGVIKDISERVALLQDNEYIIKKLYASNQELDNFAHIASHDLKEPLRAIRNHVTFLREDYEEQLEEGAIQRLSRLTVLTTKMEKLIADLLYYSRLGREENKVEETNINDVIEDVIDTLKESLETLNVTVNIATQMPTVKCDSVRITEVFRNLITNAYKYNLSEQKEIEIGSIASDPVTFYVKDNGIGIDAKFKDDIFRIFKRLNSEKHFAGGTGAGLTFVKKIVEQHGGKVWFEPVPEGGTYFYFTLQEIKT